MAMSERSGLAKRILGKEEVFVTPTSIDATDALTIM